MPNQINRISIARGVSRAHGETAGAGAYKVVDKEEAVFKYNLPPVRDAVAAGVVDNDDAPNIRLYPAGPQNYSIRLNDGASISDAATTESDPV